MDVEKPIEIHVDDNGDGSDDGVKKSSSHPSLPLPESVSEPELPKRSCSALHASHHRGVKAWVTLVVVAVMLLSGSAAFVWFVRYSGYCSGRWCPGVSLRKSVRVSQSDGRVFEATLTDPSGGVVFASRTVVRDAVEDGGGSRSRLRSSSGSGSGSGSEASVAGVMTVTVDSRVVYEAYTEGCTQVLRLSSGTHFAIRNPALPSCSSSSSSSTSTSTLTSPLPSASSSMVVEVVEEGTPEAQRLLAELRAFVSTTGAVIVEISRTLGEELGLDGGTLNTTRRIHGLAASILHNDNNDSLNDTMSNGSSEVTPSASTSRWKFEPQSCFPKCQKCDSCYGMCGPGCSCWRWVCGNCCFNPSCYLVDKACRACSWHNPLPCVVCYTPLVVVGMSQCDDNPYCRSCNGER